MSGITIPVIFNAQTVTHKNLSSEYSLPESIVDELKNLNILCEKNS